MNVKQYHDLWFDQEYPSSLSSFGFDRIRSKPWWRTLLGRFSYQTKDFGKSLFNYKSLFGYLTSADEKKIAVSYLQYIFANNPDIDESSFEQGTIDEVKNILRAQFYLAYQSRIPWRKLYPGDKLNEFYQAQALHARSIKKEGHAYSYNGFKTVLPCFEHSVLANKCSIDHVPQDVLGSIRGSIFIDCGAFTGDSAFVLQQLSPSEIIALEPDQKNFDVLIENIKINQMKGVTPLPFGAGNQNVKLKFSSVGIASQVSETGDSEIEIVRIDDIPKVVSGPEKVGLIKMDIEGHELPALEGAGKTIQKDTPVLLIALYHSGNDFFQIPRRIKELNPNYRMRIVDASLLTPLYEKYLIAYPRR